jgi:hypothetical protein
MRERRDAHPDQDAIAQADEHDTGDHAAELRRRPASDATASGQDSPQRWTWSANAGRC